MEGKLDNNNIRKAAGKDHSKGKTPKKNRLILSMFISVIFLTIILLVLLFIRPIMDKYLADEAAVISEPLDLDDVQAEVLEDNNASESDDSSVLDLPGDDGNEGSIDGGSGDDELSEEPAEADATAEESLPQPIPNRPPVITGITFSPRPLFVEERLTITAQASDPEGDPLIFNWELMPDISDLFFVWSIPQENPTNIVVPDIPCNITVKVIVNDGRGGVNEYSDVVRVNPIAILSPVIAETGWVTTRPNVFCPSHVYIGDTDDNCISRGFISFDISALAGVSIIKAELQMINPRVMNSPAFMSTAFTSKKSGLTIEKVSWGRRVLNAADYSLPGNFISNHRGPNIVLESFMGGANPNLAEALQRSVNERNSRFQLRIRFENEVSNNDHTDDGVIFQTSNIRLVIWHTD